MAVTHEETGTKSVYVKAFSVLVIADDTDVLVLLCYFVYFCDIHGNVNIVSPVKGRASFDINATEKIHTVMNMDEQSVILWLYILESAKL